MTKEKLEIENRQLRYTLFDREKEISQYKREVRTLKNILENIETDYNQSSLIKKLFLRIASYL